MYNETFVRIRAPNPDPKNLSVSNLVWISSINMCLRGLNRIFQDYEISANYSHVIMDLIHARGIWDNDKR